MKSFVLTGEPVLFTLAGCARSQENRLFDTLIHNCSTCPNRGKIKSNLSLASRILLASQIQLSKN